MVGDAALEAQAEGPELARPRAIGSHPDARIARPLASRHAVAGRHVGHGRFERPHEGPQEHLPVAQPDDGIGHELPGPVVGDLAAALDADDLDAPAAELGRGGQDVRLRCVPPQRQHRLVLHEQERVGHGVGIPIGDQRPLSRPRLAVGHPTEPFDAEVHRGRR